MKKFLALLLSAVMVLSCFAGMTFTITAEENAEQTSENLVISQDKWTVSGHCAQIVHKEGHDNSPMVAAGGIESGALLHQGAVGIGEIDLSKYSKAIISYGIDNSPVTVGHYEANANNRIMLSKVDNHMSNAPAEEDIIASATYTLEGWSLVTIEIDLTEVDYNGPVFVTYDTLPGTFMLIGKIEFLVPAAEDEGPVYEERTINLGLGSQGNPFSGAPNYNFGQRYNIGDDVLNNVSIINMATYSDGGVNKWNFKVWQWDTDYATTVAGTPLFNQNGENHKDNQTFSIDIPTDLNIRGDIYYEITYVEGPAPDKTFTGWIASEGPAEGVETYVAGQQRTDGTYRATLKVIGLPLPPDPNEESTECLFAYDFSKYYTDIAAEMGITPGPEGFAHITPLANSGYVNLKSTGGDPYIIFSKSPTVPSTQTDYVVIKYRTSVPGAKGELFTGRSDGLDWAAPIEKTHVDLTYVDDGQWHTMIVDATGIWGDNKNASLTHFRYDPLQSEGMIDVSYIKFFATREGAEACVAAETKEVTLTGEYIDGDDAIIIVGGGAYAADKWVKLTAAEGGYTDADGNGYTVRAEDNVIFDANGLDTGMHLFVDDEGTPYGAAHYFALEYQDPADGAVEIDGTKYTYTTKVALTPKMDPVLPEDNSVAATFDNACTTMSPDTLFIDGNQINDGGSHEYIAQVLGGKILDIDKTMANFSLRGWTVDTVGQQLVAEYGYQLNDQDPVFNAAWVSDGSDVNAVIGTTNAFRYKIDIDVSNLADGIYNVYTLVKLADGTVQYMSIWGNIQFVKGGSWVQVGYTDGTNTYVKAEDGSVTVNGEAGTGKMLLTDTGATYYDGAAVLDENAKAKYLYDVKLTYTVDPEIPVNPAELKPVYVVDGEALNPNGGVSCESEGYSFENGYITLVSTGGDPNSSANLVPAGTKIGRYMAVKYRTSTEGANGEVFVGASAGALGAKDNTKLPAYIADGEWHTLVADIGNVIDWPADGVVNHFRNDFLMSEGSVDIEYYAFFNTMKEAVYYAENNCHVLPKAPVYYTITFKADGEVVKEITILEGDTSVKEPKVPEKEGYTGAWEEYTITGDKDQTINAVYTKIGDEFKLDDPSKLTTFPEDVFKNYFSSPNQTDVIFNDDGSVTFKGNWTADQGGLDPFVSFNYSSLMRKYVDNKLQNVPNTKGEYGVLVLKVKADASIAGNFKLYFGMGRSAAISEENSALPDIDATGSGDYEYIIFDLSYTAFVDDVIGTLRFDWIDSNASSSEENVGASLTLYEINLYKDMDEAMIACGMEVPTDPGDDKPSDPKDTEPQATEPQATDPVTDPVEEKGCKSVIASASVLTVVAAAAALVVLKKKKED